MQAGESDTPDPSLNSVNLERKGKRHMEGNPYYRKIHFIFRKKETDFIWLFNRSKNSRSKTKMVCLVRPSSSNSYSREIKSKTNKKSELTFISETGKVLWTGETHINIRRFTCECIFT